MPKGKPLRPKHRIIWLLILCVLGLAVSLAVFFTHPLASSRKLTDKFGHPLATSGPCAGQLQDKLPDGHLECSHPDERLPAPTGSSSLQTCNPNTDLICPAPGGSFLQVNEYGWPCVDDG